MRQLLLTSTLTLLDRHPDRRPTTAELAEAAHVSIGTVYRYFADMDAIVEELRLAAVHDITATLASGIGRAMDQRPLDAMITVVETSWRRSNHTRRCCGRRSNSRTTGSAMRGPRSRDRCSRWPASCRHACAPRPRRPGDRRSGLPHHGRHGQPVLAHRTPATAAVRPRVTDRDGGPNVAGRLRHTHPFCVNPPATTGGARPRKQGGFAPIPDAGLRDCAASRTPPSPRAHPRASVEEEHDGGTHQHDRRGGAVGAVVPRARRRPGRRR